jgi:dTDP-4-dehydrorhamnose reductase
VVLLPAAVTHVDWCEQQPESAYAVNVAGAANVMRAAAGIGARVVYFSSDYIFDGTSGPYAEEDVPRPLSVYGWHKVLAEQYAATNTEAPLIIRTTGVFGPEPQGKNFVARLAATLAAGERVLVPADQVGTPTYGPDLASAVAELVEARASGVINVAGRSGASRYELALAAARVFGLDSSLLRPVATAALGQPARRPLVAGLKVGVAEALLGRTLTGYQEGLETMVSVASVGE